MLPAVFAENMSILPYLHDPGHFNVAPSPAFFDGGTARCANTTPPPERRHLRFKVDAASSRISAIAGALKVLHGGRVQRAASCSSRLTTEGACGGRASLMTQRKDEAS